MDDRKRRLAPRVAGSLSEGQRDSRRSGGHKRVREKKMETIGSGRKRETGEGWMERGARMRKLDVRVSPDADARQGRNFRGGSKIQQV